VSQCAFAVRAEILRCLPTSSFEQPAAIRATICRCRSVIAGDVRMSWRCMAASLELQLGRSKYSEGVSEGVFSLSLTEATLTGAADTAVAAWILIRPNRDVLTSHRARLMLGLCPPAAINWRPYS